MAVEAVQNGQYHAAARAQRELFAPTVPDGISVVERDLWHLDSEDHAWRSQFFSEIPDYLARYFGERYAKIYRDVKKGGRRRANAFLRTTLGKSVLPRLRLVTQRFQTQFHAAGVVPFPFNDDLARLPTLGRDELRNLAHRVADFMAASFADYIDRTFAEPAEGQKDMAARTLATYRNLAGLSREIGTEPPYWLLFIKGRISVRQMESGLLRMMAPEWWRVRLKGRRDLMREHMAIAVGQVQKAASSYVSRSTLGEWAEQKKRNREFFKAFDLENEETGERVSMADMVNGSNANPAIRRCELMVRMRGFEDIAKEKGYVGEFYTITAPSKYHSVHSGGGFVEQWNGANPRDTQKYLCRVWAKARAAIARAGISVFGFRVVEPHHDGTPHWHMLLFTLAADLKPLRRILHKYACAEDKQELRTFKARKARFHFKTIDESKGSATGYIAKYISKNIDGYALDGEKDEETGENLRDMAKAVSAWASRWRIRQFQQIGGAPVTVWRELRRLRGQQLDNPQMDAVLAAADVAVDWAAYTEAQGGPLVARADLVVRLAYDITEQGHAYAEDVQRVAGVYSPRLGEASRVCTRLVQWKVVPKLAEASAQAGVSGGNAAPWSSVNNCTPGPGRQLSALLKRRGFEGSDREIAILERGSSLVIHDDRRLILRQGRLEEVGSQPEHELWPGWNG